MKKPSILTIFLTVFIDLIGFGIVLPLLPIYVERFGAERWFDGDEFKIGLMVGLVIASYSMMQVIFSPIWGRWSDKIGRRPVILISLVGSTLSYAIFALGAGVGGVPGILMLLGSRIFAGICGANITVAQAYIADITPPENRSKKMGLIGMAFGLGFVFGPAIGAFGAGFGESAPAWIAFGLCGLNLLIAFVRLPESRKEDSPEAKPRPHLAVWGQTLKKPGVSQLIWIFFVSTFCFTCFETTLGLLVIDTFGLTEKESFAYAGYLMTYCGILGAIVQGGLIGRLIKIFGEQRLIVFSLGVTALSMFFLPFSKSMATLLASLTLLSIGTSAIRPPVFGLISILTPDNEQGSTLGVAQGISSFARCIGPIFAGVLFFVDHSIPYLICAGMLVLISLFAFVSMAKFTPNGAPSTEAA